MCVLQHTEWKIEREDNIDEKQRTIVKKSDKEGGEGKRAVVKKRVERGLNKKAKKHYSKSNKQDSLQYRKITKCLQKHTVLRK